MRKARVIHRGAAWEGFPAYARDGSPVSYYAEVKPDLWLGVEPEPTDESQADEVLALAEGRGRRRPMLIATRHFSIGEYEWPYQIVPTLADEFDPLD